MTVLAITMELLGDDDAQIARSPLGKLLGYGGAPRPWVAKITGLDPTYGFEREFLTGQKDYSHANSVGSRGVTMTYWLQLGDLYEVNRRVSWKRWVRGFCRLDEDGSIIRLTEEEARSWLRSRSVLPF